MGRAAALAFAEEGGSVMIADLDVEGAEEVAGQIRAAGGRAQATVVDVASEADVQAMVGTTVSAFGRLDAAFNNAGINDETGSLTERSREAWQRLMEINLEGVFLCMKYEIPAMSLSGGGAIVNNASIVGLSGSRGTPGYVASKHAIVGLTRAAARDHADDGIRVNAVCPGTIHTPMYERREGTDPAHDRSVAASIPMGRLGRPEDVANAVLWLCSDRAGFITGQTLVIDGGESA